MSAAFTPGPWKAVGNGVRTFADEYVCECSCPRGSDERDATVQLIAAAPEMLALLEEIARRYNPKTSRWARKALPVIAKARGDQ